MPQIFLSFMIAIVLMGYMVLSMFYEISKNEMIFKTPLETKQETIPIEIIIKLIFFKIKNAK